MKKFELSGKSYKANLHCHTTVSDGQYSPEDVKKYYMEHGYSIIAFTDHEVLIDHSDLTDDNFLALNGYEISVDPTEYHGKGNPPTCHMCFIAKKKDNLNLICTSERYIWGNARGYIPQVNIIDPNFTKVYSHEAISAIMKAGHDGGFFVTYNHPTWSLESYPEYSGYSGMDAMEIYNTGCDMVGFNEYNCHCYEDLLRQGKKIYCIAADDNHSWGASDRGKPACDCCGGWVSIFADKLEYESVTSALEAGKFYCSTGPEIKSFRGEDGFVYIETSPAHRISLITGRRRTEFVFAEYGHGVTEAKFRIDPNDIYFRIDIADDNGNHANTNAIFTEDIF
jgi:hypothetical protein